MGLATYKKKRSFSETPEPTGGVTKGKELHFVVQKHDASHLHYDLRLEMDGVLKSWAVPKGPSMDPSVKRLAMMVEDHPYDYKDFEGIIPKGQYGGGTVIVWDEGTYENAGPIQLKKGKIHFFLHGKKLKGEFALVRSSYQGEKSWLLMKIKDKYASKTDVLKKDKSVVSGKSIKQMEKAPEKVYGQKTKEKRAGKKAARPANLKPMLATLVENPPENDEWVFEVKWDGYRALAYCNWKKVELRSRNNLDFNKKFFPIREALQSLSLNAVLDGEIIVSNEKGISDFGSLQNWRSEAEGELMFYVFDILWADGYLLTNLTLEERRQILSGLIPEHPVIRISEIFETDGRSFLEAAKKMNMEGIMAKKKDSLYTIGVRSRGWLKIKIGKRHEVVIGGYTINEGTSKVFSALLVGVHKNGKLIYTGKVGTGFSIQDQKEMMKQFKPLIRTKNPFATLPDVNKPSRFRPNPPGAKATWLKPKLVAEVSYIEVTSDGLMRHPAFVGMRK